MRCADENTWEVEFWEDILDEFGPEGYVEMRYMVPVAEMIRREEVEQWTKEEAGQQEQVDRNVA